MQDIDRLIVAVSLFIGLLQLPELFAVSHPTIRQIDVDRPVAADVLGDM
ncbi:MAG: hypothetical protein H6Q38_1362 [Chloroflexi bacterium]|nr:hypothetical protein [Chloroflexota bacterium]